MPRPCVKSEDNTGDQMTDWVAIRWALLDLRLQAQPNAAEFARSTGIHRATIARIEDVISDPDYKPDLDTIQRWAEACGRSLGRFFSELDSTLSLSVTGNPDNDRATSSVDVPVGAPNHGSLVVQPSDAADLADLRDTIAIFASALAAAVDTLRSSLGDHSNSHRSDATSDVAETESRQVPRDVRR